MRTPSPEHLGEGTNPIALGAGAGSTRVTHTPAGCHVFTATDSDIGKFLMCHSSQFPTAKTASSTTARQRSHPVLICAAGWNNFSISTLRIAIVSIAAIRTKGGTLADDEIASRRDELNRQLNGIYMELDSLRYESSLNYEKKSADC